MDPEDRGRGQMKIALVMLFFLATASQVLAGSPRASRSPPSTITCETVRAYVSFLGLAQAKAVARAVAGEVRRCGVERAGARSA